MDRCRTRILSSGTTVVLPEGRLDQAAAPLLREQLGELVREGSTRLVVDLSGVEAIDSSGLGALISGLKAARQAGGDLWITAPGAQVRTVLELTNLDRVLKNFEPADGDSDEPL